jgi:hypothetical protein
MLLCVLLAVMRPGRALAVVLGIVLVAVLGRIFDHLIRSAMGEENYGQLGSILQHIGGAIAGTVAGAILGIAFLLFLYIAFGVLSFIPVIVGAVSGCVIGLVFPRFAIGLANLLMDFLP